MNTQHIIFEATVDLMKKKAIKSITMAEIAKASNVSRGTVYMYFGDKYSLLENCIEYYIANLFNNCPLDKGPQFNQVIANLDNYNSTYKILISENSIPIFSKVLQQNYYDRMMAGRGSQIDQLEYKEAYVVFLASGFTELIKWWIVNDKPISKEQLLELFNDIAKKVFIK